MHILVSCAPQVFHTCVVSPRSSHRKLTINIFSWCIWTAYWTDGVSSLFIVLLVKILSFSFCKKGPCRIYLATFMCRLYVHDVSVYFVWIEMDMNLKISCMLVQKFGLYCKGKWRVSLPVCPAANEWHLKFTAVGKCSITNANEYKYTVRCW